MSMTGYYRDPIPATVPFWLKPGSIFGLLLITTFSESSPVFTIPFIQPRLRLMLADTPLPHGFGASQMTVGTVSEGSVRVVDCNRNGSGLQSAHFPDHILCIYPRPQDRINCD